MLICSFLLGEQIVWTEPGLLMADATLPSSDILPALSQEIQHHTNNWPARSTSSQAATYSPIESLGYFLPGKKMMSKRGCTCSWSIVIREPGLTHRLTCSLMIILSLEPRSVLLNTGNPKLMVLSFTCFRLSSVWTLKAVSLTDATGSSQACEFYFWSLPWE